MTWFFDGTPNEVVIELEQQPGVWTDIADLYVLRETIRFEVPTTQKSKKLSFGARDAGGDLTVLELMRVRAKVNGSYVIAGEIQLRPTKTFGNAQEYALTIVDDTPLLETGSKQIEEEVVIPPGQSDMIVLRGGTFSVPVWQASAKRIIGDYCQPNPVNLYYYKVTDIRNPDVDGQGTSGSTQPAFPTTPLATVDDGNLVWTCMGSTAWGGVMPLYCPEIGVAGIGTIITGLPELVLKEMSAKDVLALLRKYQANSQNFDWYVRVDPVTAQSNLYTIDWNNPASVPFAQKEFADTPPFTTNRVGWVSYSRTRQGRVINAQTVYGPNGAKGEINGSVGPEKAFTINTSTNRLVCTAHGFQNGDVVFLRNNTGAHNLPNPLREYEEGLRKAYYVAGVTANTFYLTYVPGGNQITFKSSGGGGTNYVVDARYDQFARESYVKYGNKVKRGKTIRLNDPKYATDEACREYARGKVWNWYAGRDTVDIVSNVMIDPDILVAPRKMKVTNTAHGEGLNQTPYVCGNVVLSFANGGVAEWSYQGGDRYEREGEDESVGLRLGQPFPKDTTPPSRIGDLRAVENRYNPPDDWTYGLLRWSNPPERDYKQAKIYMAIRGTNYKEWTPYIPKRVTEAAIRAYPGRTYDLQIVSEDTNGNAYEPLAPYQFIAASRLLPYTFNPNFVAPNRVDGVTVPEGWFDLLGSGSTLAWKPTQVTLGSPTQGGAHIFSDKQLAQGGNANYVYPFEVQAAAASTSKLEVLVSYYNASNALISTQSIVSNKTVTTDLSSVTGLLTVPATARSMSIKAGIPAGVAVAGELYLLKVEVLEQFRVQPPTVAADNSAFAAFPYRYVRPGAEYAIQITPPTIGPAPEEYDVEYYASTVNPDTQPALVMRRPVPGDQTKVVLDGVDIDIAMKVRVKSKWKRVDSVYSPVLSFNVPAPLQPPAPSPITTVSYAGTFASTRMVFAPNAGTPEPVWWDVKAYKEGQIATYFQQRIPGSAREFTFPEGVEVDVNWRYLVTAIVITLAGSFLGVAGVEAVHKVPLPAAPTSPTLTSPDVTGTFDRARGRTVITLTGSPSAWGASQKHELVVHVTTDAGTTDYPLTPALGGTITFAMTPGSTGSAWGEHIDAWGRKSPAPPAITPLSFTAKGYPTPGNPPAPSVSVPAGAYNDTSGKVEVTALINPSASPDVISHLVYAKAPNNAAPLLVAKTGPTAETVKVELPTATTYELYSVAANRWNVKSADPNPNKATGTTVARPAPNPPQSYAMLGGYTLFSDYQAKFATTWSAPVAGSVAIDGYELDIWQTDGPGGAEIAGTRYTWARTTVLGAAAIIMRGVYYQSQVFSVRRGVRSTGSGVLNHYVISSQKRVKSGWPINGDFALAQTDSFPALAKYWYHGGTPATRTNVHPYVGTWHYRLPVGASGITYIQADYNLRKSEGKWMPMNLIEDLELTLVLSNQSASPATVEVFMKETGDPADPAAARTIVGQYITLAANAPYTLYTIELPYDTYRNVSLRIANMTANTTVDVDEVYLWKTLPASSDIRLPSRGSLLGGTGDGGSMVIEAGTTGQVPVYDDTEPGGIIPRSPSTFAADLTLSNLSDTALARSNLGAAPLANPTFTGLVKMAALRQGIANMWEHPNIAALSNGGATTVGAVLIDTPIPRASNHYFGARVRGYRHDTSRVVDFTIYARARSASLGNIDGVAGAPFGVTIVDCGNDGRPKYIGVNSSGNIAIAWGDRTDTVTSANWYLEVDFFQFGNATDYTSGWTITQATAAGTDHSAINFNWADQQGPLLNVRDDNVVRYLTNKSGGSVDKGDLVALDPANNASFTTTTVVANVNSVYGIAQATIAANASGPVLMVGTSAINSNGVSLTRGHYLYSHSVAKTVYGAAAKTNGALGYVSSSGVNPTVHFWGNPLPDYNQVFAGPPESVTQGSVLPAQPAYGNNRPFFYTGVGKNMWVQYDGTRWLTVEEYTAAWNLVANPGFPHLFTGTTLFAEAMLPRGANRAIYVTSMNWDFQVAGTHNSTNYWTLRLGHLGTSYGGGIDQDQTSKDTATGTSRINQISTPNVVISDASLKVLFLEARKDNNPSGSLGNLTLYAYTLSYKEVVT